MDNASDNRILWICNNPNTKIIVVPQNPRNGFSIYLSISGQQRYIMFHRSNTVLFKFMKDGVSLSELKRIESKARKNASSRMYIKNSSSSLDHIIKVIDEYISEELIYEIQEDAV